MTLAIWFVLVCLASAAIAEIYEETIFIPIAVVGIVALVFLVILFFGGLLNLPLLGVAFAWLLPIIIIFLGLVKLSHK